MGIALKVLFYILISIIYRHLKSINHKRKFETLNHFNYFCGILTNIFIFVREISSLLLNERQSFTLNSP